jgi:hypothetical protein
VIIYTAMPLEFVLEGMDKQELLYSEIEMDGVKMIVEQMTPFAGKVVRLISPNPQDYMNPSYAPGQMIHFRPTFSKSVE